MEKEGFKKNDPFLKFFKKLLRNYDICDCQHKDNDIPYDFYRLVGF